MRPLSHPLSPPPANSELPKLLVEILRISELGGLDDAVSSFSSAVHVP